MSGLRTRGLTLLAIVLTALTVYTVGRAGVVYAAVFTMSTGVIPRAWSTENLLLSLTYTVPVLAFLLAHEAGHRSAARQVGLTTRGPFLFPFPLALAGSIGYAMPAFGTLGAYLRVKGLRQTSPIVRWQIAARGPIYGFAVAFACLAIGAWLAGPVPKTSARLYVPTLVSAMLGPGAWHPIAFAGWFGVLLTGINLLPLPGLDGWHLVTASFDLGWRHRLLTLGALGLAFVCLR